MAEWSNAAVSPPPAKRRGPASFWREKPFTESQVMRCVVRLVLQSEKDGHYYIEHTEDLTRRLKEHNDGKTRSLKGHLPFRVVCTEEFPTKHAAFRRELQIKRYKGGEAFKRLINDR